MILREPRDVRVAVDAAAVLGFGSCGPNRGDRAFTGEVFTLYVAPDWQNQGIGRRLLIALFRRLVAAGRQSAIIWVLRDNPARFFYERLGGRLVSRKSLAFGGARVEATAYGWRDLPRSSRRCLQRGPRARAVGERLSLGRAARPCPARSTAGSSR